MGIVDRGPCYGGNEPSRHVFDLVYVDEVRNRALRTSSLLVELATANDISAVIDVGSNDWKSVIEALSLLSFDKANRVGNWVKNAVLGRVWNGVGKTVNVEYPPVLSMMFLNNGETVRDQPTGTWLAIASTVSPVVTRQRIDETIVKETIYPITSLKMYALGLREGGNQLDPWLRVAQISVPFRTNEHTLTVLERPLFALCPHCIGSSYDNRQWGMFVMAAEALDLNANGLGHRHGDVWVINIKSG